MFYLVILSMNILKGDHSHILSDTVYHLEQGASTFWVCGQNLKCDHSKWKYQMTVDKVLSRGAVYYAAQGGSNFCVLWSATFQMKVPE